MNLASGYSVQLRRLDPWAKEVTPLIRFKQIRGAFHPEAGLSMCGDKCIFVLAYLLDCVASLLKKSLSIAVVEKMHWRIV